MTPALVMFCGTPLTTVDAAMGAGRVTPATIAAAMSRPPATKADRIGRAATQANTEGKEGAPG